MKHGRVYAAAAIAMAAACSDNSPGGPSGQTCRNLPAAYTTTSVTAASTATLTGTCTFNAQTFQYACNQSATSSGGGAPVTSTLTGIYASAADVVAETQVTPPRQRRQRATTVVNNAGSVLSSETVYSYDSQSRLTSSVTTGAVSSTETFTAWDNSGRPTASNSSVNGATIYSYNDSARTLTTTTSAGTSTTTFDTNGTQVAFAASGVTTSTVIASTLSVCR
jgi:YD repeat-containing protein